MAACCCCELKTGVLIIAILGWIFTLTKIFGLVRITNEYRQATAPISLLENVMSYGFQEEYSNPINQLFLGIDTFVKRFLGLQIGYAVISLIACVLLVVGVAKKNRYYFLPWMIINFMEYLLFTILTIVVFGFLIEVTVNTSFVGLPIFLCCLFSFICAFCWYLWAVVQSYYVQLRKQRLIGHLLIPTYEN